MSLLDYLLGQEGVRRTDGSVVFDPNQDLRETRFDPQGNQYQAPVGSPDIFAQQTQPSPVEPEVMPVQPMQVGQKSYEQQVEDEYWNMYPPLEDLHAGEINVISDEMFGSILGDLNLDEYRSTLDTTETAPIMQDTDDFGNPVDTNFAGQSAYEIDAELQAIRDNVMMQDAPHEVNQQMVADMHALNQTTPNVDQTQPEPTFGNDWYGKHQEITHEWRNAVSNAFNVAGEVVDKVLPMMGNTTPAILLDADHPKHDEAKDMFLNLARGTAQGVLKELPQGAIDLGTDVINYGAQLAGSDFQIDPESVELPTGYTEEEQKRFEDSGAYQFGKIGGQFFGGYAGAKKLLGKGDTFWKEYGKDAIAGAISVLGLDPEEENISNFINSTEYKNAVTEFLAQDIDPDAEYDPEVRLGGRLKNVAEEMGIALTGPAVYALAKGTASAFNPETLRSVMEKMPGVMAEPRLEAVPGGIHPETEIDTLGFYSEAENVLNKLPQEKNNSDDIKRYLKKNGVTQAEMDETGLTAYLNENKKVTKAGMLNFMHSKKTELEEGVLEGIGDDAFENIELDDPEYVNPEQSNFEVIDDYEYYMHKVEDIQYDMENAGPDYDRALGMVLKMNEYAPEKYPLPDDFRVGIQVAQPELPNWWQKVEDDYPNHPDRNMIDNVIDEVAKEEYLQYPTYRWEVLDPEDNRWRVEGNEDTGMFIINDNGDTVNRDPIYSLNEAQIQLHELMREDLVQYGDGTKWHDYTTPNLDRGTYKEYTYTPEEVTGTPYHDRFHGGHFEEGVMSHIRASERRDYDGNIYHFVEEFQSDQHQAGRQKGYQDKDTQNQIAKAESKKKKAGVALAEHNQKFEDKGYLIIERPYGAVINDIAHNRIGEIDMTNKEYPFEISANYLNDAVQSGNKADLQKVSEDIDDFAGEYIALREKFNVALAEKGKLQNKIPNAPLKDDQWLDAMFKRSIMNAIEEGRDRVAWTNADLQKSLYSNKYAELYENTYDKKLPSIAKKIAERHGGKTGTANFYSLGDHDIHYIEITPQMKDSVMKGQSMYGATSVPSKKDLKHKAGEARDKIKAGKESNWPEGEGLLGFHHTMNEFDDFKMGANRNSEPGLHFGLTPEPGEKMMEIKKFQIENNYIGKPDIPVRSPNQAKEIVAQLDLKKPLRVYEEKRMGGGRWDAHQILKSVFEVDELPKGFDEFDRDAWYKGTAWAEVDVEGEGTKFAIPLEAVDQFERSPWSYSDLTPEQETAWINDYLQKRGYDHIVYDNAYEGGGDSIGVFDLEKIKKLSENRYAQGAVPTGLLGMEESEANEIDSTLLDMIKGFEAFKAKPYYATASEEAQGLLSIGFGETEGVKEGDTITEEEAEKKLIEKLIKARSDVRDLVKTDLTNNQEMALTSLVYNVGRNAFRKSKALKALNKGDIDTFLKEAFDAKIGFVKDEKGGKILKGLVDRRAKERELFNKDAE